jgi:hypothetical protein
LLRQDNDAIGLDHFALPDDDFFVAARCGGAATEFSKATRSTMPGLAGAVSNTTD